MARRTSPQRLSQVRQASGRQVATRFRPRCPEFLEQRTLLDGGLPVAIVVGRTLATVDASQTPPAVVPVAFANDVKNNQVQLTLTAYNEQADDETGVLLTDTLAPGVTLVSASPQPDQQGQNLAWSLGTIHGFDRASVTLTVSLSTSTPLPIDTGANVFATLDAAAVTNTTPAATLRAGGVSDPTLLASTPDANTTDPFIQEEAAKLNYDPQNIFNFLHTQVGYNSYDGSVRGARGTLWSLAGNALDVSSLGVALMRASGIPAQYVSGTLSATQASQLILTMFPPSLQTVGYVPAGTQTSDPANDPQLLAETEQHNWFQFDAGGGMKDADPLFPTATVGATFTASTGTFSEVSQNLRATTEITLNAEITSTGIGGLGGGSGTTSVLDQTFNDVDLVGKYLSIGNDVSQYKISSIVSESVYTYAPYLVVNDLATADPAQAELIRGQSYQEFSSSFGIGNQILTGLFLDVTETNVGSPATTEEHTILDRVGYAARQTGSASGSLSVGASPALSESQIVSIGVSASLQPATASGRLADVIAAQASRLQSVNSGDSMTVAGALPLYRQSLIALEDAKIVQLLAASETETANLAVGNDVAAYFDHPRLTVVSSVFNSASDPVDFAGDLLDDTIRVEAAPGQAQQQAVMSFESVRGFYESGLEGAILANSGQQPITSFAILQQALAQQVPIVVLSAVDIPNLPGLGLPADATARLTTTLEQGNYVIIPIHPVTIGGVAAVGWFQINPNTGATVGVLQDGTHGIDEGAESEELSAVVEGEVVEVEVEEGVKQLPALQQNYQNVVAFLSSPAGKVLKVKVLAVAGGISMLKDLLPDEKVNKLISIFAASLYLVSLTLLFAGDPPSPQQELDLDLPFLDTPPNPATSTESIGQGLQAGAVSGNSRVASLAANGQLAASWASSAITTLDASSLTVSSAQVADSSGKAVGTGAIALATTSPIATLVSGSDQYNLNGTGSLSVYGPSESTLGVSGNWQSFTANVTGNVAITLAAAAGVLSLNGQALPAGIYTLTTNSATLSGSGATASPSFSGSVAIAASAATVNLGSGTGSLTVGGKALDPTRETTLTGYSGTINVSANGDGTDAATINGNAGNVLQVTLTPATLTTDQNTPVTFAANVQTSLADTYTLTATAPAGWTVTIDASGNVTATPASGLQGGTYPIQIIARSSTNPDLVAQSVVNVTITPTAPGLTLNVASDSQFTVPFNGAQLPTAFQASIQNLGPATDTYTLSFSNVPAGFTLLNSGTSVAVPAGQTGILGLYLQPNTSQPIPPPGTQLSFTVTATSTTTPTLTKSQVVTFTVPAIDALTVTADQPSLTSTSGTAVSTTVRITAIGNVAETVTPSITLPPGVTASGLNSVTIQPGQTVTQTLTLTPDATVALNSPVSVTFTETYGPAATPQTTSATVSLIVRSAQVLAVQQAAGALANVSGSQVGTNLSELADALSQLQSNPTSGPLLNRVQFLLGDLNTLLLADPALASFATGLQPLQTAANSGDVNGLLGQTAAFFNSLTPVLTQEADQQFTASLSPTESDLAPGQGTTFNLQLTSQSNDPIALTLGVVTLPSGVTVTPAQTQVTLAPGQTMTVPVTLSQTVQSTSVFTLDVTAAASLVKQDATAVVAIRPAAADVLSVTTSPGTVNPGSPVAISTQVFNTANAARSLIAHVDLLDGSGNVLKSVSDTPLALVPGMDTTTVNLPAIDSTGLGVGVYYARVTLEGSDGGAIPGHTAQASFLVGISVSASISASTSVVPPGVSTVSTTISVAGDNTVGSPGGSSGNSIELYYTRYGGNPSVQKVQVSFDGTTLTVGTPVTVNQGAPADGILFLPDGRLVVGAGPVTFINPLTGAATSYSNAADHLALDPSGTIVWTSPQPGSLVETPVADPQNDVVHPLSGDDTVVTQLAFDQHGTAYYVTGSPNGVGNFGIIDLKTFTTRRLLANVRGAHGIIFDPFTNDFLVCNFNEIDQIDPTTGTIVSTFTDPAGVAFDQGSVDGKGHIYVADNSGNLEFVDYSKTKLVGDPSNFHARPFVTSTLDDTAPLVGLGSLGILTDVNEDLATGFNIDPTSITPAPSSSSPSNVEWFGNIALTDTAPHQFQVTGTVANMSPGEVRQITKGATVLAQASVNSTLIGPPALFVTDFSIPGIAEVDPLTGVATTVDNTGYSLDSLVFDSDGDIIYSSYLGNKLGIFDPSTKQNRLIDTLPAPADMALDPGGNSVVVNCAGDQTIKRVNIATGAVAVLLTNVGEGSTVGGIAYDELGHLFLAEDNASGTSLVQIDPQTGAILQTIPLHSPGEVDGVTFDPVTHAFWTVDARSHILIEVSNYLGTPQVREFPSPSGFAESTFDGIESDGQGNLFIAEYNTRVDKYNIATNTYTPLTGGLAVDDVAPLIGNGSQQLTTTINLLPLFVAADHIITIDPPAQTTDKNTTVTYTVTLTNPLSTAETYTLNTDGLTGFNETLADSIPVGPGQTVRVPLTVSVPTSAADGTFVFVVSAQTLEGGTDSVEGQLTITPTVAISTEAVNLQITPAQQTVGQGTSTTFDVLVTNVGDVSSTYSLSGVFPTGVTGAFSQPSITVAPGEGNARHVMLTLTASATAALGNAPFSVSAVSTTDPSARSTVNATLNVTDLGVQVALSPATANPGDTLQLKVTNTGTVPDTYALALGGPAALVSTLGSSQVTLAAGASVTVPITTTAVNFAVPGALNLIATATSQANPAVQSAATSALNIAGTHGLGASLSPSVQVLPVPGTTDFLLLVNNTGNVEDSYNAVITGTTGPLSASLTDLEGNPTQTIPLFRLPGLSTGAILIHTGLATIGTGTVSVRVTSTTNPAMTTSQTATVTALAATTPTTTTLTIAPNPSAIGETVTFLAVVAPATGTGTPTGNVTFTLDGTAQAPVTLQVVNGMDEATFTTSTFDAGAHTVSAAYSGDPQFTASMAGPSTVTVNAQAPTRTTSSTLLLAPNPSTPGQAVTFTAIVSPTTGTATPTGTVTFRIDGVAQTPIVLQAIGGQQVATFTTSTLAAGSHTIAASYSGDAQFAPSTAGSMVQVVSTSATDGPKITDLERFGYHEMPTTLVLTFDGPLAIAPAQNINNYTIIDPHGHRVGIKSATYDAATDNVVIRTKRRLNVHRGYRLTVVGTGSGGVSGSDGLLLDGGGTGAPGSDYHAIVDRSKLVIGAQTPTFAATKAQRSELHGKGSKLGLRSVPNPARNPR